MNAITENRDLGAKQVQSSTGHPEIAYYRSLNANGFNGNANAGIPPSRNWAVIAASDLIFHF
jgi:hypothetical protein